MSSTTSIWPASASIWPSPAVARRALRGLKIWLIDRKTRKLADITFGGVIAVFGGGLPYGSCTYRSARNGLHYVFINNNAGRVEQYRLDSVPPGVVGATKVREFALKSITEGCVADDESGFFYIAQEKVGIWQFPAEPDEAPNGKLINRVGENGLKADVEGLTLYCAAGGKGYLIASSQGNSTFKVYERDGEHRFLMSIVPKAGAIDEVSDTDGIAVTNVSLGERFPRGLFVVQDGATPAGRQNFKLYRWEDIAVPGGLLIDTTHDTRKANAGDGPVESVRRVLP